MSKSLDTEMLSQMVRSKRGNRTLRETASEIGEISAPTLSRIEQGNVPDVDTFLRLCNWLQVPADTFNFSEDSQKETSIEKDLIVHLRADKTLPKDVVDSLVTMISLAYKTHKNQSLSQQEK